MKPASPPRPEAVPLGALRPFEPAWRVIGLCRHCRRGAETLDSDGGIAHPLCDWRARVRKETGGRRKSA